MLTHVICGILLRLFFTFSAASAQNMAIMRHFRHKNLIMIRPLLVHNGILQRNLAGFLNHFLQMGLAVQTAEITFCMLDLLRHKTHNIFDRRFHAAIQTDCTNNCLKRIRKDRIPVSAACAFLALTQQHRTTKPQLSG